MAQAVERLTLEHVRALDPARELDAIVDVVVASGRIEKIAPAAAEPSRGPTWDATGCWLLPSLTDLRARLGQPGHEYKETIESGLGAAAAGGYGAVCALPDTVPPADEAFVVRAMLDAAQRAGRSELLPVAAATRRLLGEELAEFGDLKEAGAVAVSNADAYVASASLMRRIFEYAQTFELLVMQQPTEPSLALGSVMHEGAVSVRMGVRGCPSAAERIAIERDFALVRATGARYHASALSSREAVESLERAKNDGLPVTADVCFANLLLSDTELSSYDTLCRAVPPLRRIQDRDALIAGLESGLIDAVCTNHSPQSPLEKSCEFDLAAPGMIGFELCLAALLQLHDEDKLSLKRLVDATSLRPARILGRRPPTLEEGSLANFTLVDPKRHWIPSRAGLLSKSRNTPFLNRELRGKVLLTVAGGAVVYDDREAALSRRV